MHRAASHREHEDGNRSVPPQLSAFFKLTPFEQDCVLVCIAPEVRRKYERLYAYLQDDIHKKKPTIDLLLKLLCATENERFGAYEVFQPHGSGEIPSARNYGQLGRWPHPLLSRSLKLDDRLSILFSASLNWMHAYVHS